MITKDDEWDSAEVLDGVEIIDKAELVGIPILLTSVWFQDGNNDVQYIYVTCRTRDGREFTFNDSSSTGVKFQLSEYLAEKRGGELPMVDKVVEVRILVPRGLRVSKYEVQDKGRVKTSKTYYLTTSGKHA